jgi:prepilin-type N-terminal cleavage/methylation domain-containing protein
MRLHQSPNRAKLRRGVSLTELLCVLAILSVLVGLYASAVVRAYLRIMKFLESVS